MHVVYILFEMDFHHNKVMWQKPMQRDHNQSHHVEVEWLENLSLFSPKEKKGWQVSLSLYNCV